MSQQHNEKNVAFFKAALKKNQKELSDAARKIQTYKETVKTLRERLS